MEAMKELATAYFDRSSNEEMASAVAFFKRLGGGNPGNGKVTLSELRKSLPSHFSDIIRQLDEDGDEKLDFDQVLTVHYMANIVRGLKLCDGCDEILLGTFFSCSLCLDKGRDTFDLCCKCYQTGNVAHEHSLANLLDQFSFLSRAIGRLTIAENTLAKKDMEDLHEIAQSHYHAGSQEIKDLARKFFNSLDTDGDGKITLTEFLEFTKQEGRAEMRDPQFFQKLDKDGNGTLDFFEVMKLYYIIRSGRPFCHSCECFIPGTFFSCVECFFKKKTTCNLCHGCYKAGMCRDDHGGKAQFLDNYTLLQVARDLVLAKDDTGVSSEQNTSSVPSNAGMAQMNTQPSRTIVVYATPPPRPSNKLEIVKAALNTFEAAFNFGSLVSSVCTIL